MYTTITGDNMTVLPLIMIGFFVGVIGGFFRGGLYGYPGAEYFRLSHSLRGRYRHGPRHLYILRYVNTRRWGGTTVIKQYYINFLEDLVNALGLLTVSTLMVVLLSNCLGPIR